MKNLVKFGLGVFTAATGAHLLYHGYQDLVDELRAELTATVRAHFAARGRKVEVLWIFDDPAHGAVFAGGVVVEGASIAFEIDAKTLEVTEFEEEKL